MSKLKNKNKYMYSFTIEDKKKYKKLINFLENIDNGARAYIIRQILQNYINSDQTAGQSLIDTTEPEEFLSNNNNNQNKNALKNLKNKFGE